MRYLENLHQVEGFGVGALDVEEGHEVARLLGQVGRLDGRLRHPVLQFESQLAVGLECHVIER